MTCAEVRHQLLASECPDQPGPEESRHLANCPACHAWLRRLVRLERQIPQLAVPASAPPADLLKQVEAGRPAPPLVRLPAPPHAQRERVREFGRQKLALACSLAASLALFAFAWWAWPPVPANGGREAGGKNSYVRKREKALEPARTPPERVWALTKMAEDIVDQAQAAGDDAAQVAGLAREFDRLVQEDLPREAKQLSPGERAQVLPVLAKRFGDTESKASRLAGALKNNHPASARALEQIARRAAEADQRLRQLAGA